MSHDPALGVLEAFEEVLLRHRSEQKASADEVGEASRLSGGMIWGF